MTSWMENALSLSRTHLIVHEVRTQHKVEGSNLVGLLRNAAGQGEHSEQLIGLKHDKLGTKHHTRLVCLVVVDLHRGVVGHAVCDSFPPVTVLGWRCGMILVDAIVCVLLEQLLDNCAGEKNSYETRIEETT